VSYSNVKKFNLKYIISEDGIAEYIKPATICKHN